MNPCTVKDFFNDPALRRRLFDKARRERSATVRAGLGWLRDHLTPRLHPSDWLSRLG